MQSMLTHLCIRVGVVFFLLLTTQVRDIKAAVLPMPTSASHQPIEQTSPAEAQPPTPYRIFLPLLQQGAPSTNQATVRLSTPQLLAQALANGEITADEEALYLAYALYEPQSLPARFQSTVGWRGTRYVQELQSYFQNLNAAATSAVQQELARLQGLAATVCDKQDGANNINSTNFHFNYDTINGGLTINDYITSLETTFDVMVTQYDWAEPPLCTGGDTCSGSDNPFDRYPVQVSQLGSGLYGYVMVGGGQYSGYVGDNPNSAATETSALASCMVLNDEYSLFFEGAQAALDATTAHEFVHSIQYGYGDEGPNEDDMWYESSAAYMEDEVFDSSDSNYIYLWPVISNSLGQWPNGSAPFGISEYSNFLFFRYAAEQTGGTNVDAGGEDVMQRFWENVAAGQAALTAYDNALGTKSTNLADLFHNYAIAARFSKACGAGYAAAYCFEEGAGYIAFADAPTPIQGSITSITGAFTGSINNHYAANWIDLPLSASPYRVTFSNTATGGQLRGSLVCDTGTAFTVTPFASVIGAGGSTSINSFNTNGCTKAVAVITNQEQTDGNPGSVPTHSYTLALSAPEATATTITIVLDSRPNVATNLGFNGSFGPFPLDDPAIDDGDAYTTTRTFTVAPGTYTVRRNNSTNWFTQAIVCTPSTGTTIDLPNRQATITITEGEAITCTFTVEQGVRIIARAFNDLVRTNANLGRRNARDEWQEGWSMTLSTSPTTTVASGVTSSTATPDLYQMVFRNLRPGSYTICETLQAGWTNTSPGSIDPVYGQPCKSITLSPGQGSILLFGNYESATVAREISAAAEGTVADNDQVYDLPVGADEDKEQTE